MDAVDDMTAQLAGTRVSTGLEQESEQEEDSGDENTGLARRAPPAYGEPSSHFGVPEAGAEEIGNGDAALHLWKAKMAMVAAHSARRVGQADMRSLLLRSKGGYSCGTTRLFDFLRCAACRACHFFVFLATSKRVRQANRREFVPTTAVHKYVRCRRK